MRHNSARVGDLTLRLVKILRGLGQKSFRMNIGAASRLYVLALRLHVNGVNVGSLNETCNDNRGAGDPQCDRH